jgi:hypothetical protein
VNYGGVLLIVLGILAVIVAVKGSQATVWQSLDGGGTSSSSTGSGSSSGGVTTTPWNSPGTTTSATVSPSQGITL